MLDPDNQLSVHGIIPHSDHETVAIESLTNLAKAGDGFVDCLDPAVDCGELLFPRRFSPVGFVGVAECFRELIDLHLKRWARFGNERRARPAESFESLLDSTPAPSQFLPLTLKPGDAAAGSCGVSQPARNHLLQIDRGAGIVRGTSAK